MFFMHRPGEPLPVKSIRQESVILHLKSEEENFTLRKNDDETSLQYTLLSSCQSGWAEGQRPLKPLWHGVGNFYDETSGFSVQKALAYCGEDTATA